MHGPSCIGVWHLRDNPSILPCKTQGSLVKGLHPWIFLSSEEHEQDDFPPHRCCLVNEGQVDQDQGQLGGHLFAGDG